MKTKSLLFIFIVLLFSLLSISTIKAQVNVTDSSALADLYNNTNGPGWKNSTNWLTAKPVSKWYGVTVTANRVTAIVLNFNKMKGQLPASIGNLSELTDLEFAQNNLSGSFNPVVKLTKLVTLDLGGNAFGSTIPEAVGKLSQLQYLSLSTNRLTGTIPASIFTLKSLVSLFLSNNQLTGSIPANIDNLSFLSYLYLSNNQLSGPLPAGFYRLYNLVTVELEHNQLSGSLSPAISNFGKLVNLILDHNQFSGSIPLNIAQLGRLSLVYLQNNQLSGSIPSKINYCTALTTFDFSNNQFTGPLPSTIASLPKLAGFNVSNNRLSGELPPQLITNASVISFKAAGNHLTCSKNLDGNATTKLSAIDISNNNFNFNGLEYIAANVPLPTYKPQAGITIHQQASILSVAAGGKLSNNTYKWHRIEGGISVIQGDSVFTPTATGSYYVTVTNSVATALTLVSDTVAVTIVNPTSQPQLSLAPNPVINSLTISGLDALARLKITVLDIKGTVWINTFSNKQRAITLDVSLLKQGSYIIRADDGKKPKTIYFIKD
jgi:Leucine-rich repeat (LRR) protein